MLGFDVVRADWGDALRDRAFRRGLLLLPAGERTLRFYPRYDTEGYAIDEALGILRHALEDLVRGRAQPFPGPGPEIRVGTLEVSLEAIEVIELRASSFDEHRAQIVAVEVDQYGGTADPPANAPGGGRGPSLQLPAEMLVSTLSSPGALGVALRDRVTNR